MEELLQTEVLIIGCGIAGAVAALQLAEAGIDVTIVTRAQDPTDSNTYHAQGGIIYRGHDDSPELLAQDILRAGAGHCNPKAVTILSQEGPDLVKRILIEKYGVQFDHGHGDHDEELSLAREGGHSVPRIVHAVDATGKAIELALMNAVLSPTRLSSPNPSSVVLSMESDAWSAWLLPKAFSRPERNSSS